ncbi:AMP-binding protein [Streptacidiphilus sp. 4-A2]|nr:AMP-binding protein [Streptacidiphilus sp. 4-A2]
MAGVAVRGPERAPARTTGTGRTGRTVLLDRLVRQAGRTPEHPALEGGGRVWNYAQVLRDTERVADWLRAQGVRPGDVVAVHARRVPELALALLAVAHTGAAFSVFDAAHPAGRLREYAEQVHPRAWLDCGAGGLPAGVPQAPLLDLLRPFDGPGVPASGLVSARRAARSPPPMWPSPRAPPDGPGPWSADGNRSSTSSTGTPASSG